MLKRFLLRLQESTHQYECKYMKNQDQVLQHIEFDLTKELDIQNLTMPNEILLHVRYKEYLQKLVINLCENYKEHVKDIEMAPVVRFKI